MDYVYPQEVKGTTLYEDCCAGEHRRVYCQAEQDMLEVGELTHGELTYDVYGTDAHFHCVHIENKVLERGKASMESLVDGQSCPNLDSLLLSYFEQGRYLADLMDDLDERGVPYGYLNMVENGGVTYRPSRSSARRYPHLRFVDS